MKKLACIILLIILFCSYCNECHAQQYYFANYTLNDGLPHSRVNAVIQAKNGYFWVATNMGISRFDGHFFVNYSAKDGLGDNKVTSVFELSDTELILGHENGKLSYYNGSKFEPLQLDPDTRRIFCLTPDHSGNLWIGTQTTGAYKVSRKNLVANILNKQYDRYDAAKGLSRDVTSFLHDSNDQLWFITDLGIKQLNNKTGTFDFYLPSGIDFVQFSAIAEDGNKDLWLGTPSSGCWRYSKKQKKFISYTVENGKLGTNFVSVLQANSKGEMMIGTWGGGVTLVNGDNVEILAEKNGLSENKIRCLGEDREGNLWIGTNQNGVSCYRGQSFRMYERSSNGTNTQIGAICTDSKGNHWFGSTNGIFLMPKGKNESQRIDFLTGGEEIEVTSILEDRRGLIWVSTWGEGVLLIHPGDYQVERFQGKIPYNDPVTFNEQYVHTIYQASNGTIWISMLRGVAAFSPSTNQLHTYTKRDGLAENSTTDIQEDSQGRIWIGSASSGLSIYENGRFNVVKETNPNIYPSISSISRDEQSNIWIATEGGGIYKFDGKKYTNFTTQDGLLSNYVGLIESDLNGKIWMGTNKGICSWDPNTHYTIIHDKTDKNSRVETKPNAVHRDKENHLWFGTINGVLEFDPGLITTNFVESVTRITAVKSFQDTLRKEGVALNYKKNYLSFYFNGICFSDPEKVRYKFQLEGFDSTWQESSVNFVTYNNLAPGSYNFRVKSCNNDGVWNKIPISFAFSITPPFWMTWWFYTISFIGLTVIIVSAVKFRERNLRLEKRRLEQVVQERTSEIIHQKEEIENQRDELRVNSALIEQKNLSITDSIRYARRIQLATLPYSDVIYQSLPESFILYKPKDIVSGDFYAFAKKDNKILIAVADCTGHGVPGAFMSMIGTNLFNQVINEKNITEPAAILNELDKGIERALKQEETDNHDGMDIVICSLDFENGVFEMAGANRPLWIIRNGKIEDHEYLEQYGNSMQIIRPDKNPIGGFHQEKKERFTNHPFNFYPGDILYLCTDGYADQFGGEKGKKLLSKRLRDYLIKIQHSPIHEQEGLLDDYYEEWRGNHEQVDDVLIIGIRFPKKS
jgi:ligand-binding sensor domain-containing protein/serine phosphatase RsbU (regulator of sigma subunit)